MFQKDSWAAYRWAPSSSFQERKITLSSWEARLVKSLNFYFWLDWFSSLKILLPRNFEIKEKMFLFPSLMWTEKRKSNYLESRNKEFLDNFWTRDKEFVKHVNRRTTTMRSSHRQTLSIWTSWNRTCSSRGCYWQHRFILQCSQKLKHWRHSTKAAINWISDKKLKNGKAGNSLQNFLFHSFVAIKTFITKFLIKTQPQTCCTSLPCSPNLC